MINGYYHMIVVDGCPFCDNAKELAKDSGVLYFVEDATDREEWLNEAKEQFKHGTVPIINWVGLTPSYEIEVKLVGGFTEFKERLKIEKENTKEEQEQE